MTSRPPLLIVLCFLGLVGCFLNMMMVLSPPVREIAPWFPGYLSAATALAAACLGGLWFLKRWALWGYTFYFLAQQSVFLLLHRWDAHALILPLAVTATAWAYSKNMK